jgi:ribonuclease R
MRWLKAEYMVDHIGETFSGAVSGVTGFGLFVTLDEIFIDGLVHITSLGNDYYQFDAAKSRLTGERTHKTYRPGDRLQVVVVRVDVDEGRIDLELADDGNAEGEGKSGSKKKSGRDEFMSKKPKKGKNKHGSAKRGKTLSRNKTSKNKTKGSKPSKK